MVERSFRPGPNVSTQDTQQRFTVPQDTKGKTASYIADRLIGSGAFGVVYLASVAETAEQVAIKKVLQDRRYKNRELQIMKDLQHPNIVGLKHAFYSQGDNPEETFLNIVMDYVPDTVHKVMKAYTRQKQVPPPLLAKLYTYQLLRALAQMHAVGICHRDIKPQNLLVDPDSHLMKLCDFGSAKKLIPGEPNVSYICSRYYRAPELIIGATDYTNAVDIWSCGCVCAELLLGQPLFPGENSVDQMVEVIKVLGTPTVEQLRLMNPAYTEYRFPLIRPHPWPKVFRSRTPAEGVDFVSRLVVYPPAERPKALECLLHPFFDELRQQDTRLPNDTPLPDLFNFTAEEEAAAGSETILKLMPQWYR